MNANLKIIGTPLRMFVAPFILSLNLALAPGTMAAISEVSYWRLGESEPGAAPGSGVSSIVDVVGANNLTVHGVARFASDVAATAANYTGSSLSVNFTNGAYAICPLVSTAVDNFGIECWVKPTALGGGQVIAYNGATGGFGDGGWGIIIAADNTYEGLFGGVIAFGTNAATPNVWTHLALVRASGVATLYVNGVAAGTITDDPVGPSAGGFALAAPPQSPTGQLFTGLIDEVRVFTFAEGQFSTNDLLCNLAFRAVSYWRMGESDPGAAPGLAVSNTVDLVGTRNLTVIGPAQYTNDVSATAANYTGSSLSVNFTNGAYALRPLVSTAVDNFGIECWVKPTALGGGQVIAYNGATGGFGDGGWGLIIAADNTYEGLFGGVVAFGTNAATPNVWTHLALVRASGVATLYVNGVAAGSVTDGPIPPSAGGFALAAPPQSPTGQLFTGLIDEVRVFTFASGQFSTTYLLNNRVTPPVLSNPTWSSNGRFSFTFTNIQTTNFTVLFTTDLSIPVSNWTVLGAPSNTSPGVFQFSTLATNRSQGFYSIRSP